MKTPFMVVPCFRSNSVAWRGACESLGRHESLMVSNPRNRSLNSAAASSSARVPITDSPWFWAYLFGTAAVVALMLAGPRYSQRQPQLERQFAARQRGGQAIAGPNGSVPPSTSEQMIISLRPLYILLIMLLSVGWIGFYYRRFH